MDELEFMTPDVKATADKTIAKQFVKNLCEGPVKALLMAEQQLEKRWTVDHVIERAQTLTIEEDERWGTLRAGVPGGRPQQQQRGESRPALYCLFARRAKMFVAYILNGKSKPLGEIVEHAIRTEFQDRGSPHLHMLLWPRHAPPGAVSSKELGDELQRHIDDCIMCARCHVRADARPNQGERSHKLAPLNQLAAPVGWKTREGIADLDALVSAVQMHTCKTHRCMRGRRGCRYGFPKPPRAATGLEEVQSRKGCLKVAVRRGEEDGDVNAYNPQLLRAWRANMDIQFCLPLSVHGAAYYVAMYVSKQERERDLSTAKLIQEFDGYCHAAGAEAAGNDGIRKVFGIRKEAL